MKARKAGVALPFDAQEATRSIVRVMHGTKHWGCGFVVADEYVITAAHCLPRLPDPDDHPDDRIVATIRSWDRGAAAHLVVVHCDYLSDVAVLSDEGCLPDRIVERTGSARVNLSFPVESPLQIYIRTHKGDWVIGSIEGLLYLMSRFLAPLDEGASIPGGTSGSPVFNKKGEVIGVYNVSEGAGVVFANRGTDAGVVWLAGALPGWLIRKLEGTGRDKKQIEALMRKARRLNRPSSR